MSKAKLAEGKSKKYWKARGENGAARMIPLHELDDDHLQRAYFVTQNKELELMNKSIRFAELGEDLEKEALSRGITLRSIEDEPNHKVKGYFANNRKFKAKI